MCRSGGNDVEPGDNHRRCPVDGGFYAHSKADFIAKLQIALKECSESEYWLELLIESGYHGDKAILDRCVEIKRILISSINTAKENTQK